jgi:putative ABC transport system permease protein
MARPRRESADLRHLLRARLFGLQPDDPLSFGLAIAGITIVTIAATLLPARRALSVDPMLALRSE